MAQTQHDLFDLGLQFAILGDDAITFGEGPPTIEAGLGADGDQPRHTGLDAADLEFETVVHKSG